MSYDTLGSESLGDATNRDGASIFFNANNFSTAPIVFQHIPIKETLLTPGLTVGPPVLARPPLRQIHALAAHMFATGSPILLKPSFNQNQHFNALSIGIPYVDVGNSSRSESTLPLGSSQPLGHNSDTEVIRSGFPFLRQNQRLPAAGNIVVGSPVFGHPVLGESFGAYNITVGSPVFGHPTLGYVDLTSGGVYDLIGIQTGTFDFVGQWDVPDDTIVNDFVGIYAEPVDLYATFEEHTDMTASHPLVEQFAGDNWYLRFTNFKADNTKLDLSGAQIVWTLLSERGVPMITLNQTNGIAITDAPGGVCVVAVNPAQTVPLAPGRYQDKLVVTASSGVVSTTCSGPITVRVK